MAARQRAEFAVGGLRDDVLAAVGCRALDPPAREVALAGRGLLFSSGQRGGGSVADERVPGGMRHHDLRAAAALLVHDVRIRRRGDQRAAGAAGRAQRRVDRDARVARPVLPGDAVALLRQHAAEAGALGGRPVGTTESEEVAVLRRDTGGALSHAAPYGRSVRRDHDRRQRVGFEEQEDGEHRALTTKTPTVPVTRTYATRSAPLFSP